MIWFEGCFFAFLCFLSQLRWRSRGSIGGIGNSFLGVLRAEPFQCLGGGRSWNDPHNTDGGKRWLSFSPDLEATTSTRSGCVGRRRWRSWRMFLTDVPDELQRWTAKRKEAAETGGARAVGAGGAVCSGSRRRVA